LAFFALVLVSTLEKQNYELAAVRCVFCLAWFIIIIIIIIIIIYYLLKKTTYSNRKASERDRQAQGALTSALMVQVQ